MSSICKNLSVIIFEGVLSLPRQLPNDGFVSPDESPFMMPRWVSSSSTFVIMSPRRPGHFHPRYAHSSRPDNENQQPTNNGNQLVPHAVRGRSSHNQSVRRYQNTGRYRNRNRIRQGRPQDGNNADHQMAAHNRPVPMAAGPVHDGVFKQEITRRPASTPGMPAAHIEQQNSHSPPPLSVPQVGQMHQEMHQPHIQFPMAPSRTPTPRLDIPNNGLSVATMVPNQHIDPPMSSLPMTVHNRGFHQRITRSPTTAPGMPAAHIDQQNSHSPPPLLPQVRKMHQEIYHPHIRFPMAPSLTPTPRLDIPNNGFSIATVVPNQHIYPPMSSLPMTPDTPTAMFSHPNGPLQSASMHPTRHMNHPNQGYFTPAPSPGLSTQQLMYHESEQPLSFCQQTQDSGHDLNPAAKECQPLSSSVPTSVDDVTQRISQLHIGDPVNASQHFKQVDSVSNISYPPTIQERRMSRNISQGHDGYSSLSTSYMTPSGPQTPVSLYQDISQGYGSALQQNNVQYNLIDYPEDVRKAHEPRGVSHRLISESHHVEETVGQQPHSLESQSGQSSVFPSGEEDEVAQKAERVPSVFNHTHGRPENSQNLDHPRHTTEILEYTTGRPSHREHHTADPLIGLLPWSTGEETLLTSRNAQYEIHSSEKGDGNHIDSAGPAGSSTSYVLPTSSALSNRSLNHWQHEMEILSPAQTENGLLNKHEVIQKLLDILSTCDGAQRQCVFEALLAIDRAEAPQMPDMLMRYPGTLVILIDEIIHLTQQLARSKSRPHNAVHRGSGVLRVLQRMAAENEVAQFLKNDHIPPRIYTEKHLFGAPSLLECLVNGDLAPKRGSDAECWVKITQDIRVEDKLLNDFPNIGASFSDVLNTMTSEEDEAAESIVGHTRPTQVTKTQSSKLNGPSRSPWRPVGYSFKSISSMEQSISSHEGPISAFEEPAWSTCQTLPRQAPWFKYA
ncbi:hypothetical protein BZA77DRAFT_295207 [Pyronema omphalodes]|nr:hypothetical protein BZA77DRAFT_295207 [Pyronema omphalodes]